MRKKLLIEYEGTGFVGWQKQQGFPSIAGHVEDALSKICLHTVELFGASRTDAGVHALAQAAHFDTEKNIPNGGLLRGANSYLPPNIAIVSVEDASESFHSRFDSKGKIYTYRTYCQPIRSPLKVNQAWHLEETMNTEAMLAAAKHLTGEHDFDSFRAAGCGAKHARRHVTAIDIEQSQGEFLFTVKGNAFVRNMVRILVGTLVDVGLGKISHTEIAAIRDAKDRTKAGRTAPAYGLTLVSVHYDRCPS